MNELRDVRPFVGGHGDHITAVGIDVGAFEEPFLGLQIDRLAAGNLCGWRLV